MNKKAVGFCVLILGLAFLFLWEQVQAVRVGYDVSRERLEMRRLRDRIAYLRLEIERLQSPESLAARAEERLGMSPPGPEHVFFLGSAALRPSAAPAGQGKAIAAARAAPPPERRILALAVEDGG